MSGWVDDTTTVPVHNQLSLEYHVEGSIMLASDGLSHRVTIAALEFAADVRYICVPRAAKTVFIEAHVENTSEYELLAGPVSVFMDGGFVTKTSLGVSLHCPIVA